MERHRSKSVLMNTLCFHPPMRLTSSKLGTLFIYCIIQLYSAFAPLAPHLVFEQFGRNEDLRFCSARTGLICILLPGLVACMRSTYKLIARLTSSKSQADMNTQWNDCVSGWNGSSCSASSGWDCVCSNSDSIDKINSCVASSCTNATDAAGMPIFLL